MAEIVPSRAAVRRGLRRSHDGSREDGAGRDRPDPRKLQRKIRHRLVARFPWLLLGQRGHAARRHARCGSRVRSRKHLGDGEYATLIDALDGAKVIKQRRGASTLSARPPSASLEDGGTPIDIIVDFLMPRDAEIVKNVPPLISDFAVQKADGADLGRSLLSTGGNLRSDACRRHQPRRDRRVLDPCPCSP
jgi:hypothetical protein